MFRKAQYNPPVFAHHCEAEEWICFFPHRADVTNSTNNNNSSNMGSQPFQIGLGSWLRVGNILWPREGC